MKSAVLALFLCLTLCGCVSQQPPVYQETGLSSWYGWKYAGHKMASGERFWPYKNVAAHKTLPFGTLAYIVNLENGRTAWVRIADRGPVKEERILDVSKDVAKRLKFKRKGLAEVRVEVYEWPQ